MPALAALMLTTAVQGAMPSPLFAAFKVPCASILQFDTVSKAALAAGWSEVADKDADPRIAAIIARGRAAVKQEEPGATTTDRLFRHKADGRDVWLATSRVTFKDDGREYWANGCRAYDLDAPAAPTTETITRWVGKPPTGVQASGNAAKASWEPWRDGVTLEITYVPRDNPLGAQFGIQGLILVSQAMGGF